MMDSEDIKFLALGSPQRLYWTLVGYAKLPTLSKSCGQVCADMVSVRKGEEEEALCMKLADSLSIAHTHK